MQELSHLGIAVGYRKIGVVVLRNGRLTYWDIAKSAFDEVEKLKAYVTSIIDAHDPNVVATECVGKGCRKGERSQQRIIAIGELVRERRRLLVTVPRNHEFQNKYEEAAALASHYPDLQALVTERVPCWEDEPRCMILFEALALADAVLHLPPEKLAAAMG